MTYGAIVIGGGMYGARIALACRAAGASVLLLEREATLLGRASLVNQARVHMGYHYPRSILTSVRSRRNYDRFGAEYGDAVYDSFDHYYAIARDTSRVTAAQFKEFCTRVGAPLAPAPERIRRLFDPARIEEVFLVRECAFDAVKLRAHLSLDLHRAGVEVLLRSAVSQVSVSEGSAGGERKSLEVHWVRDGQSASATAPYVYNCTYSAFNMVLAQSGASIIPLKRELTEMALIQPPPELRDVGITVMDGPFFSMMPWPSRPGLCTLSHVRYTPHCAWFDTPGAPPLDGAELRDQFESRFPHMIRDAARFLPVIAGARYVESLFEIKGIMPRSEQDDSRPILFRESPELPGLITVLGAKIDSVYDVEAELSRAG
jgi:glycine/D-amino acid oxidase-like deaminating enzyme